MNIKLNHSKKWLKDQELAERFGLGRSTIWVRAKVDPKFPKPKKISNGLSRWDLDEILEFENNLKNSI